MYNKDTLPQGNYEGYNEQVIIICVCEKYLHNSRIHLKAFQAHDNC